LQIIQLVATIKTVEIARRQSLDKDAGGPLQIIQLGGTIKAVEIARRHRQGRWGPLQIIQLVATIKAAPLSVPTEAINPTIFLLLFRFWLHSVIFGGIREEKP